MSATVRETAHGARAKCDRCGWRGIDRVFESNAWKDADAHDCLPTEGDNRV